MVNSIWIIDARTGELIEHVPFEALGSWLTVRGLRVTGGGFCWVSVESD